MEDVLKKAEELADAIAASETYLKMKSLEEALQEDPEASEAVNDLMRKRQRVEDLLTEKGMNPEELKRANQEMVLAEKAMNANPKVAELKAARRGFSQMMEDVNRVLRMVITGEIRDDDFAGTCSGNCGGCSGCG